jgi:hypothetical protein
LLPRSKGNEGGEDIIIWGREEVFRRHVL